MWFPALIVLLAAVMISHAQSGRSKNYSESNATTEKRAHAAPAPASDAPMPTQPGSPLEKPEPDVIKVETDLVIVPFRVADRSGRNIADIREQEVKIFENGAEREIAYFSDIDQPFTVALLLDMSYSSVFKLGEIQDAAKRFVSQMRPQDRVMVISFAEKPVVLCEPTGDRRILNMAIDGARIGSGTGLYLTLDTVLNQKLSRVEGRKAVVLLSDGVDTSSKTHTASGVRSGLVESDVLIYPIRYNTYDDVQKSRRETSPIQYDDDDRPYVVEGRPGKGERPEDYSAAKDFLQGIAADTGGRLYNVTSTTNLDAAFSNIANELRKIYTLGYYPSGERESGASFEIKVRVYRPDLVIRTRERSLKR
jgi:Ca-activated chloride channel homolog